MKTSVDWKKYLVVFLITSFIFLSAIALSNHFNEKRIINVREVEDKIALDILSSETQFSLLAESSCKDVDTSFLLQELNSLAEKIDFNERNLGDREEIKNLKKSYSLLEVKDYLLMKKVSERCGLDPVFILYFYSSFNDACPDCQKQGFVLSALREKHPELRVYTFDYHLDLSVIRTLISIFKVPETLPALVIEDRVYTGFQSVEDIEDLLPILKKDNATSTATSTKATPKASVTR